jgi:ribosomal protein S18 acetylase RimI-like enzyme
MLDKTIPYKHILMKRPKGMIFKNYDLPVGYSFCRYNEGNELQWSEIEASVAEFDDTEGALKYYNEEFMPHMEELKRRQFYIRDSIGQMIATITAWWKLTGDRRDAVIHWVAVRPEYQGRGLGKALVAEGIKQMQILEGDVDMYLHTQTWSYKAINIYLDAGFEMLKDESFGGFKNEYEEAIEILGNRIKIV